MTCGDQDEEATGQPKGTRDPWEAATIRPWPWNGCSLGWARRAVGNLSAGSAALGVGSGSGGDP